MLHGSHIATYISYICMYMCIYTYIVSLNKPCLARFTHICVGNLTIICSYNGLSPGQRQAIIWTNAGILLIGPLGTNFSEILIEIHKFPFKDAFENIVCEMAAILSRPQCVNWIACEWRFMTFSLASIYRFACKGAVKESIIITIRGAARFHEILAIEKKKIWSVKIYSKF